MEASIRGGSPEASRVVWRWKREDATASESRGLSPRVRGVIQACAGAAVGGLLLWSGRSTFAAFVLTLAGIILLAALVSPTGLFAAIDRAFLTLGRWVGRALAWMLLVPVFYLFVLPFGWVFRSGRRDLLKRYLDPEAETYWEKVEGRTAPSGTLEKQY